MKIALAQFNPTVGDIRGNADGIIALTQKAQSADLVVFGELSLIGYPPKDLLLKPGFIDENIKTLDYIAARTKGTAVMIGFADRRKESVGRDLHNAAALIYDGKVQAVYYKQLLPTYDVFDESRYFESASSQQIVEFQNQKIGLTICEDIWNEPNHTQRTLYQVKPFEELARQKVDFIINMSASPFVLGKPAFRRELFAAQCQKYQTPLIYVNQVGGNDELVFDGNSCAFNARGELICHAQSFTEDLLIVDTDNFTPVNHPEPSDMADLNNALVLGLRDYLRKCRFKSVVLGLSGGIDSAITAALAVQAIGPEKVTGIAMPSRYSSDHSVTDAEGLAQNLGIEFHTIPIESPHHAMEELLQPYFKGRQPDITEENIQARLRGVILMSLSNKFGHLLLTTGNKSELAVGYCTMYGDMAGGLAVISDVPKTMVYDLARYINRDKEIIPESTITKPPSAELRPDQTDQDSLPPYDILDDILQRYVEQEQSTREIIAAGHDEQTVKRVVSLVDINEYKRKQAAPGLKVTSRAFGFGRRMPIAQNYKSW